MDEFEAKTQKFAEVAENLNILADLKAHVDALRLQKAEAVPHEIQLALAETTLNLTPVLRICRMKSAS